VTLASRSGTLAIGTLLLCGLAVSALAFALIGFVSYASDDRELRDLTLWTLGSLSGSSWPKVFGIAPFAILLMVVVPPLTRALNGLLLGETEAFHLGVAVERSKWLVVLATAAAVGASVAVAGLVSFVGVIVPHMVRAIWGPDHRNVLPASAVGGATLMLLADLIARMLVRPAELPIGIVLAVLGAPVFLHLVLRRAPSSGA
jgi:iron complex transport system permease protein